MTYLRWYEATKLVLQFVILAAVVASAAWMQVNFLGTATNLASMRADIIKEVTTERERRLNEVQNVVRTEQRRQDGITLDIATAADSRASIAETKAEVARAKALRADSRASAIEKRQRHVERVLNIPTEAPYVDATPPRETPTPAPAPTISDTNPKHGGLLDFFR